MKEFRINESKNFCMAPWVHLYNTPNGDIYPCCVSLGEPIGNLYKNNIDEIWNNENYRTLRKNLLDNITLKNCERCTKEEEWGSTTTLRRHFNESFGDFYEELVEESTTYSGKLNKMNLLKWDFRFNNLCNLACIGCGPEYSSTWSTLQEKITNTPAEIKFFNSVINQDRFIQVIKTQVENVKKIYFAGGEPLIQMEHYQILEELQKHNKLSNLDVTYSTNLTTINFKSTNIFDFWKQIDKLRILVSLDEVDMDRLFYLRYPADFKKIESNIKELNANLLKQEQDWVITPTWNILNIHRIKEIIQYFLENNLLPKTFFKTYIWDYDYHNIILVNPSKLSISCADERHKKLILKKLIEYEQWYIKTLIPLKDKNLRDTATEVIKAQVKRFVNALNENVSFDKNERINYLNTLDNVRNTNYKNVFPELIEYIEA